MGVLQFASGDEEAEDEQDGENWDIWDGVIVVDVDWERRVGWPKVKVDVKSVNECRNEGVSCIVMVH